MTSPLLLAMQEAITGRTCSVERHDWTWRFVFGNGASDGCTVTTTSWWRIISEGRLAHAVEDDGQQFGLPAPVDGVRRSSELLSNVPVASAFVDAITSDLIITFERGLRLDILNSSCGYESWQANFRHGENDVTLISGGGGEIDFVTTPAGSHHQVVVGQRLPRE